MNVQVLVVIVLTAAAARAAAPARFVPAPGSPIPAGPGPGDVLLADFDGDRRLDLASASREGVTIRIGDGRGGFTPASGSPLATSGPPHLLAAAELDRDGRIDLVATSHDTHAVTVWLSAGGGRFVAAPGSPVDALPGGKAHNHGLAIGDLDADGWPDVTTADDERHVLVVLLGGPAGLRPRGSFPVGNSPYPHALGDLNGDGRLDAVVPNTGSANVGVLPRRWPRRVRAGAGERGRGDRASLLRGAGRSRSRQGRRRRGHARRQHARDGAAR